MKVGLQLELGLGRVGALAAVRLVESFGGGWDEIGLGRFWESLWLRCKG